jgi:hypothetical protein
LTRRSRRSRTFGSKLPELKLLITTEMRNAWRDIRTFLDGKPVRVLG